MEDLQYIERVRAGDKQAFAPLVRRYQQPVFRYLGRLGLGQADVEELAQETFLRAYRHLHAYDPHRAQFSTWLLTIARRLGLNALAHGRRREVSESHEPAAEAPAEPVDERLRRRLARALARLPVKFRSPLALAYLRELSVEEIAGIEGCAPGTVKSRIHRAKHQLRLMLADLLEERSHE